MPDPLKQFLDWSCFAGFDCIGGRCTSCTEFIARLKLRLYDGAVLLCLRRCKLNLKLQQFAARCYSLLKEGLFLRYHLLVQQGGNWAASVHCAARFHHAANTHPQPETNLVSSYRLPQLTGWATWAESLREECRSRVVNSVSAPILYLRIGAI